MGDTDQSGADRRGRVGGALGEVATPLADFAAFVAALRRFVTGGELVAEAAGLDLTLHRVVDLVADVAEALEVAVALGFRRVLSSGGARVAVEGVARLG